jgi:hypothetical protein
VNYYFKVEARTVGAFCFSFAQAREQWECSANDYLPPKASDHNSWDGSVSESEDV